MLGAIMAMKKRSKNHYIKYESHEKFRIAVMYQVASYWPTIESFYRTCREDCNTEIKVFYVNDMSVEKAQVENSDSLLKELGVPFEIYSEDRLREYNPHAALYQPPYDVSYRNPSALSLHLKNMGIRIIYIPYGIEIADTEDARYNHFFTYVIRNCWRLYTFSEAMREDYFRYCPNRHAVRALGVPKFDAVFNYTIPADKNILAQADGRKMILWKMHFPKIIYEGIERRQVTPYLSEYWKFAEALERYTDLFFIVMPHPMFFSQTIHSNLADDAKRLFQILELKENVWIDRSADYRKVLYHSDAIIVDRSALMVEAGLCGVPVLYMKNKDYEEPLTKAVKSLVDSYEQGTTAEDIKKFVEDFKGNKLQIVTDRITDARKKTIPFMDGKCGERILEDIKFGLQENVEHTIGIVFFCASFICEHYINELGIRDNPHIRILGMSDNDSAKWGTVHAGIEVVPPEELKGIDFDVLVIMSEQYYMPVKKQLVYELFLEEDKILRLDEFSERYLEEQGMI